MKNLFLGLFLAGTMMSFTNKYADSSIIMKDCYGEANSFAQMFSGSDGDRADFFWARYDICMGG